MGCVPISEHQKLEAEAVRLRERVEVLGKENSRLRARIAVLDQERFGRRSERSAKVAVLEPKRPGGRRRGQRAGVRGHGRRSYEHLPKLEIIEDLAESEKRCEECGRPFDAFPGTEDSQQLEVELTVVRRVHRRKRYRPGCRCRSNPGIVAAPRPAKLIPKGAFGISVWVWVLLDKYLLQEPTHRLTQRFETHGVELSQGTLTGGLKRLSPLLEPIYEAIRAKLLRAEHWHADETTWRMLEEERGWWLWVFAARDAVFFVVDPTRAGAVPKQQLEGGSGVLSVDRYAAYQSAFKDNSGMKLSFCWSHVRRDFLRVGRGYRKNEAWARKWVRRIKALYRLDRRWRQAAAGSSEWAKADGELRAHVAAMERAWQEELAGEPTSERERVLQSLERHWEGLVLFLDQPHVPLDNNLAERALRGPVVGRKNYYGSGAEWSGRQAAMLFSIFATLKCWELNPRLWLTRYLEACAQASGKAPERIEGFLPWGMSEAEREALAMRRRPP